MGFTIQFEVRNGQNARNGLRLDPSQHRFDPGHEFRRRERFDDIVIRSGFKSAHPLAFLAARGQHQDWQSAGFRPSAQPTTQFYAGKTRKHPVEDEKVGNILPQSLFRLVTAVEGLNHKTFRFQIVAQQH